MRLPVIKLFSTLLMALTFCVLTGCKSDAESPFGIKWNSTIDEFPSSKLMTVNRIPQGEGEDMIYTTSAPENGLGTGSYRFYFSHQKLVKIVFSTYDITGPDTEEKAKSTYEQYKKTITGMLGAPVKIDEKVYLTEFLFVPCITNEKCGAWKSYFSGESSKAILSIEMGLNQEGYRETRRSARISIAFTPK